MPVHSPALARFAHKFDDASTRSIVGTLAELDSFLTSRDVARLAKAARAGKVEPDLAEVAVTFLLVIGRETTAQAASTVQYSSAIVLVQRFCDGGILSGSFYTALAAQCMLAISGGKRVARASTLFLHELAGEVRIGTAEDRVEYALLKSQPPLLASRAWTPQSSRDAFAKLGIASGVPDLRQELDEWSMAVATIARILGAGSSTPP